MPRPYNSPWGRTPDCQTQRARKLWDVEGNKKKQDELARKAKKKRAA